jgi:hypothetical protein
MLTLLRSTNRLSSITLTRSGTLLSPYLFFPVLISPRTFRPLLLVPLSTHARARYSVVEYSTQTVPKHSQMGGSLSPIERIPHMRGIVEWVERGTREGQRWAKVSREVRYDQAFQEWGPPLDVRVQMGDEDAPEGSDLKRGRVKDRSIRDEWDEAQVQ